MNMKTHRSKEAKGRRHAGMVLSAAKLDKLIEEATVDCYNDSEALSGFFTMIAENLAMPFVTRFCWLAPSPGQALPRLNPLSSTS